MEASCELNIYRTRVGIQLTSVPSFFDLFVAMCKHVDDFVERTNKSSPRTI